MKWKPDLRKGVLVGAGMALVILLVDAGLLWRVIVGPIGGWTFVCAVLVLVSFAVLALVGYRIYDLSRLAYELDRDRLVIATAGTRQIVPTCSIERVIDGREAGLRVRRHSLTWPGCFLGQGQVEGVGLTLFAAVTPPAQQMIVVTPSLAYGISVDERDSFLEVLTTCQEIGPSIEVQQASEQAAFVDWPIWRDRLAQGVLLLGLATVLALFGFVLFRYPILPDAIPMHYDASGSVDRISPKVEVFALPVIGAITLLANVLLGAFLYRGQRVVSYMLWSGAVLVQIFFLLALWQIVF